MIFSNYSTELCKYEVFAFIVLIATGFGVFCGVQLVFQRPVPKLHDNQQKDYPWVQEKLWIKLFIFNNIFPSFLGNN